MPDFPTAPTTAIRSIEDSEHKQEAFNKLLSGWSPSSVSLSLRKKYGEYISIEDLAAYRKQIPDDLPLKVSELAERLKRIDVEVDALLVMQRVLVLYQQRLDEALLHARVTSQQDAPTDESEGLIDKRARTLFDACRKYVLTLAEIGQVGPPVIELEQRLTAKLPILRQVLEPPIVDVIAESKEEEEDV